MYKKPRLYQHCSSRQVSVSFYLLALAIIIILPLYADQYRAISDIEYRLLRSGEGNSPVYGNEITVLMSKVDENGKLLAGEIEIERTYILGLDEEMSAWERLLLEMKVGDEALTRLSIEGKETSKYYLIKLIKIPEAPHREWYDIDGKTKIVTPSGLSYILISQGSGSRAAPGYTVTFHFTGYLEDGTVFSSSYIQETPITVTLGIDPIILGWYHGLCLMNEGDQMRLIIPPELAYGEEGAGEMIPPNALLIFDIDLLIVE